MGLINLTFARSGTARHFGDQYSFSFHYYSLGGNAAMPRGLHAGLCHAVKIVAHRNWVPITAHCQRCIKAIAHTNLQ